MMLYCRVVLDMLDIISCVNYGLWVLAMYLWFYLTIFLCGDALNHINGPANSKGNPAQYFGSQNIKEENANRPIYIHTLLVIRIIIAIRVLGLFAVSLRLSVSISLKEVRKVRNPLTVCVDVGHIDQYMKNLCAFFFILLWFGLFSYSVIIVWLQLLIL